MSFFLPKASKFLEKTFVNEKSLPHAKTVEISVAKLIAGNGLLFILGSNLIKNSAAKCCASAAEPPLPQSKTFPPCDNFLYII